MGKKYIIELEDKPFHNGNGDFLYRVKGFNSLVFDRNGLNMLTPYTEPDLEQVRKEAYEDGYKTAKVQCNIQAEKDLREVGERHYQKGLEDIWRVARKIILPSKRGGFTIDEFAGCFGSDVSKYDVVEHYSASETIEKIRQYERGKEEQIQVGDEVKLKCGVGPAIYMQGSNGSDEIYLLFNDGSCGFHRRSEIECKTGRHFSEISEVLKKMREGQEQ